MFLSCFVAIRLHHTEKLNYNINLYWIGSVNMYKREY